MAVELVHSSFSYKLPVQFISRQSKQSFPTHLCYLIIDFDAW